MTCPHQTARHGFTNTAWCLSRNLKHREARLKVFWFFSGEKNKESSFSEEKEAKRLLSMALVPRRCCLWFNRRAADT
jgi:hypothetical protein